MKNELIIVAYGVFSYLVGLGLGYLLCLLSEH
jgi:hypothetical protein